MTRSTKTGLLGAGFLALALVASWAWAQEARQASKVTPVRPATGFATSAPVRSPAAAVQPVLKREVRRYIYAHCTDWHAVYALNLLGSGQRIGTDWMFPSSIVRLFDGRETYDMTLRACAEARALGYSAMPGVVHGLSSSFGHHDASAWLEPETWARYAKTTILASSGCDSTRRMVVDLEPYWEGERYLPNTEQNRQLLREAMRPWIQVLQRLELKLYVLPGYHESYAYCSVLAEAGVVAAWCGEGTYADPCSEAVLAWIRGRDQQARAATGVPYLSGHYARKLRDPQCDAWLNQFDHWIYISGWPEDDKWDFGKAEWFQPAEPPPGTR